MSQSKRMPVLFSVWREGLKHAGGANGPPVNPDEILGADRSLRAPNCNIVHETRFFATTLAATLTRKSISRAD